LAFNVVGRKADADQLVGRPGAPQVRSIIVGAQGGWGVAEAVKEIPNPKQAKAAEVLFQITLVTISGIGPGAYYWPVEQGVGHELPAGGWRTAGGAPGKMGAVLGGAARRRSRYCIGRVGDHRLTSTRKFELDLLGEELIEVWNRDVDRRVPLSLEPLCPPHQLIGSS
jgi:hypothetical protein